jgi:RNA polymerase sigma factor (sigma-70 family)
MRIRILSTKDVVWPQGPTVGPSGEHGKTFEAVTTAITRFAEAHATKWADYDTARDIGQEVAVYVWKRRRKDPTFLDGSSPIAPYVRVMVETSLALRWRRVHRAEVPHHAFTDCRLAYLESWTNPERAQRERELMDLAASAWGKMPKVRRTVFRMVREEGMTYEAAAQATALSENTIRRHVVLAGKDMRRGLAGHEVLDPAHEMLATPKRPKAEGE